MAWGQSTPKALPPPSSAFSKLFPFFALLLVLGIGAFVAYHLYLASLQISHSASDKLAQKNVSFSKDGLRVGVKEVKNKNYVDSIQGSLVRAWNLSSWPEYKSRYWNKSPPGTDTSSKAGPEKRQPYSRSASQATK